MAELPGEDFSALRSKFGKKASGASLPGAAARRREADRKSMLRETDGRRSRGSGVVRDAQVNFKVSSATKQEIVELSREIDQSMVWILERGLELVRAESEGRLTIADAQGDQA